MGLLTMGEALNWTDTKQQSEHARKKGVHQFINLFNTFKDRDSDPFKYGDEVEFSLIKFNHKEKRVYALLKAEQLIPLLQNKCQNTQWTPEFANFMLEGLPAQPYEHDINCISLIEPNMRLRRKQVQDLLGSNESVMTFSTFPLIGSPQFTWPSSPTTPGRDITSSVFFPDNAVFRGHPRYAVSLVNNRERRKSKMCSNIPIYMDKNTPKPFKDDLSMYKNIDESTSPRSGHIYLEGIGASCSCLQVTFQARNLDEARHLYDQLAPLTPIILALSASSPIWRGLLSDIDCRWQVISESLDDRTAEEKGEAPLINDKYRLPKSRYDSLDCYLSSSARELNDIEICKDEGFYMDLLENGVDGLMAQHVSHLFTRDPLVLFKESLQINDGMRTDLWENIQSTNWQSLRFKPPPNCDHESEIGWRVEFRTTELQITDFENAAFVTFLVLLTRAMLSYGVNFLIPISKIDENMKRAFRRDACLREKFFFKTNLNDKENRREDSSIVELSIDEIVNGSESLGFKGLMPLVREYLAQLDNINVETNCKIKHYLKLIENKANGKVKTTASWMRSFVSEHSKYKFDSIVTDEIAYDLMWHLSKVSNGFLNSSDLIGNFFS